MLSPFQIAQIHQIIMLYHAAVTEAIAGTAALPESVLQALELAGIPRWSAGSIVEQSVIIGLLSAVQPDPFKAAAQITGEQVAERMLRHREIPLSVEEARAVEHAQSKAAVYCRGLGNRVDETTGQVLIEVDREQRAGLEADIREQTADAVKFREGARKLRTKLGRATGDWTRDLQRIANTESNNAIQMGRAAAIAEQHGDGAKVAKIPNENACETCKRLYLEGGKPRLFRLDDIRWSTNAIDPDRPGKGRRQADMVPTVESAHPNCFLPGTVVQGRVEVVTRALYSGEAVEILTASGKRLSVTLNHPIPTADGRWVAAGEITDSDDLLCYSDRIKHQGPDPAGDADFGADYEQNAPASVEDLFRALAESCAPARLQTTAADFHGDAVCYQSEVDIVCAKGVLPVGYHPGKEQCSRNLILPEPFDSRLSRDEVPLDTLCSSVQRGFRHTATPASLPSGAEGALDGGPVSLSGAPPDCLLLGQAAQIDTSSLQRPAQRCPVSGTPARNPEFSRQLMQRFPGKVAPDHVVNVRKFQFSGHVYNLQSPLGWVIAQALFASNCFCQLTRVPEGWGFDDDGNMEPL